MIYLPVHDVLGGTSHKLYKYLDVSKFYLQKRQEISFSKDYSNVDEINVIATRREDEFCQIQGKFSNCGFKVHYLNVASSIKFCYLAEGVADIYLRMAKIKLWDVIAGFHITKTAGLEIMNLKGRDIMSYVLTSEYLQQIYKNEFRIDEFMIKSSNLAINCEFGNT